MASNTDFTGGIGYFLSEVLSTPAGALPNSSQWVLQFDDIPVSTILTARQYEPNTASSWDIGAALNISTSKPYQSVQGCIFAQSVTIPGEGMTTNPTSIGDSSFNGFIRGVVGGGRDNFEQIKISFLDTNVGFGDNVIRPWIVVTSHLGMIARPASQRYRTNLTIYKLGIFSQKTAPVVIQQYNFVGVCPINLAGEEYSYIAQTGHIRKEATFVYSYYNTQSGTTILQNTKQQALPLAKETGAQINGEAAALEANPNAFVTTNKNNVVSR